MFKPVGNSRLLSQQVETEIEAAIRSRKLVPGTKLPSENELCAQFEVSRTAMREALRVLHARGLIRIEKGRGMFVNELSADTVTSSLELYLHLNHEAEKSLHVINARQLIEPAFAAQAALRHTAADAEKLKKDLADLIACEGSFSLLSKLDMDFHLHIAEASGNPLVPLLIQPIHKLMPQIKASVYGVVEDAKEAAVEWHSRILECILERDAEGAHGSMVRHLEIARQHIERTIEAEARSHADGTGDGHASNGTSG